MKSLRLLAFAVKNLSWRQIVVSVAALAICVGGLSSAIRLSIGNRSEKTAFLTVGLCDSPGVNDALKNLPQNSVSLSASYNANGIGNFDLITESSEFFSLFQTADDLVIGESYAFNTGLKDGDKFLFLGKERVVRVAENNYFYYALRYDAELSEKDIVSCFLQLSAPINAETERRLKTLGFKKQFEINPFTILAILAAALALWVALAVLRLFFKKNQYMFGVFLNCGATAFNIGAVFVIETAVLFALGAGLGASIEHAIVDYGVAYSSVLPPLRSLALVAPLSVLGCAVALAVFAVLRSGRRERSV